MYFFFGKCFVVGVRYYIKFFYVKVVVGFRLFLVVIFFVQGVVDLVVSKIVVKCFGCWCCGWQLGFGLVVGGELEVFVRVEGLSVRESRRIFVIFCFFGKFRDGIWQQFLY